MVKKGCIAMDGQQLIESVGESHQRQTIQLVIAGTKAGD